MMQRLEDQNSTAQIEDLRKGDQSADSFNNTSTCCGCCTSSLTAVKPEAAADVQGKVTPADRSRGQEDANFDESKGPYGGRKQGGEYDIPMILIETEPAQKETPMRQSPENPKAFILPPIEKRKLFGQKSIE